MLILCAVYDESIENSDTKLFSGIKPDNLPRNKAFGCAPVYLHSFPYVNNIFEVAKGFGQAHRLERQALGVRPGQGAQRHRRGRPCSPPVRSFAFSAAGEEHLTSSCMHPHVTTCCACVQRWLR